MTNYLISGTFDRLHDGHKLLFQRVFARFNNDKDHLLVEVANQSYVSKFKQYSQIVQSETDRVHAIESYLDELLYRNNYTVVVASDEYGAALRSMNIDVVMCGLDSLGWFHLMNEYRAASSDMNQFDIVTIPRDGMSSTKLREKELNHV